MSKVNHPEHYNRGKIECIDVIEDWKLNFHLGNAVKYISRAGAKDNEIEDIEKAIWYLQRYVEKLKEINKIIEDLDIDKIVEESLKTQKEQEGYELVIFGKYTAIFTELEEAIKFVDGDLSNVDIYKIVWEINGSYFTRVGKYNKAGEYFDYF